MRVIIPEDENADTVVFDLRPEFNSENSSKRFVLVVPKHALVDYKEDITAENIKYSVQNGLYNVDSFSDYFLELDEEMRQLLENNLFDSKVEIYMVKKGTKDVYVGMPLWKGSIQYLHIKYENLIKGNKAITTTFDFDAADIACLSDLRSLNKATIFMPSNTKQFVKNSTFSDDSMPL